MAREVREELGYGIRLTRRIGDAIQFFYASDDGQWYEMEATFFCGELEGNASGTGEHELCWIDGRQRPELFFHACHAWAASQT